MVTNSSKSILHFLKVILFGPQTSTGERTTNHVFQKPKRTRPAGEVKEKCQECMTYCPKTKRTGLSGAAQSQKAVNNAYEMKKKR